jgi:hypothetical protein
MIKKIIVMMALCAIFPTSAFANETEEPLVTLPEFAYTFAEKGTTLTLKHDVYILLPDAWALINTEFETLQKMCQLKCDTKLKLQKNQYELQLDLYKQQVDYLSGELDRTNDLLILTQEQKTIGDWSAIGPAVAFVLGVATTTAIVYALKGGEPIQ